MWCTNMTGIHKNDVKQKTNYVEWNLDIMHPIQQVLGKMKNTLCYRKSKICGKNLVKANAFGLSLDPLLYHGSTVYTVEQWNRSVWVLWKLLLVTIVLWRTCRYYAVLQISWLVSFSDHIIYNTNRLPMEGKKDKKHLQSYTTCFCTYLYY